jgi:hypothetical protein
LYASLVVKKSALYKLDQSMAEKGVEHTIDDYHVYRLPSIAIAKNPDFANLAHQSASQVIALLSGLEP